MTNYLVVERELVGRFRFENRPVAVTFLNAVPSAIKISKEPWLPRVRFGVSLLPDTFYALSSDHYNCAVGAYTYHISLPTVHAEELGNPSIHVGFGLHPNGEGGRDVSAS